MKNNNYEKQHHSEDDCLHTKILNYRDSDSELKYYTSDELQNIEEHWFPLCCYRDDKTGNLVYGGRNDVIHSYSVGATGVGKTTRFVMQSIRALSSKKDKPSFIIVDIHGEIIENLYSHLIDKGYDIRIINCDNPSRSDSYNPLASIAKHCKKVGIIDDRTSNLVYKLASIMQPIESKNDPIWDIGARSYVEGLILSKFEDLIEGHLSEENITIYNIMQNHYWLRDKLIKANSLHDIPGYNKKSLKSLSLGKMISVTNNAERTRASYFGVVENHFDKFGQKSLFSISSNSTISAESLIDKPTAVIIQSDSTSVGDNLISLLMNDIYLTVLERGKQSLDKCLPRQIHCFLDEFANSNIADGKEFIKMLTTSRKFGLFWHMFLQCDAQLENKFNSNIRQIIQANCTEIFMGTNDYATEKRFSEACGKKFTEIGDDDFFGNNVNQKEVPLISTEKLNLILPGNMYVRSCRHNVLYTYFEPYYKCPEFKKTNINHIYPYNSFDYKETYRCPDDYLNLSDCDSKIVFLLDIEKQLSSRELTDRIVQVFPEISKFSVVSSLHNLAKQNIIRSNDGENLYLNISDEQLKKVKNLCNAIESEENAANESFDEKTSCAIKNAIDPDEINSQVDESSRRRREYLLSLRKNNIHDDYPDSDVGTDEYDDGNYTGPNNEYFSADNKQNTDEIEPEENTDESEAEDENINWDKDFDIYKILLLILKKISDLLKDIFPVIVICTFLFALFYLLFNERSSCPPFDIFLGIALLGFLTVRSKEITNRFLARLEQCTIPIFLGAIIFSATNIALHSYHYIFITILFTSFFVYVIASVFYLLLNRTEKNIIAKSLFVGQTAVVPILFAGTVLHGLLALKIF